MKDFFTEADCDCCYPRASCISLTKANVLFNEWLSRGTAVYGKMHAEDYGLFSTSKNDPNWGYTDTHTALLINIEPIEQDSAEKFVKDFNEVMNREIKPIGKLASFITRAKRLLERGGK